MSSPLDKNCTVLFHGSNEKGNPPTQDEILKGLESPKVDVKIKAAKDAILALLNGESLPKVLMYVIRFCSTHEDHQLKKLLMIYWEVVKKYDANKKLLPEMILVCNALLNDLNSPNEFIRGCMLRFLCKIKEPEILEPLKDAVKSNLEHRHSYVRRNAVMTVFMMYKNFGELLIPDAPELIEHFLASETDTNARRNAFLMLFETCEEKAVNFLMNSMDQVQKFGDGFSLIILELTRKVCRRDPTQKSRFVRCIFQLLNSASPAVSYEAAWTLITLSSAPTAVRAAAKTYAGLLAGQSDNNLKLIVLDRLQDLKKYHTKVLQEILMDIMRVLTSPSLQVCKKVMEITLDLVSPRNIEEVVQLLKREVIKTQDKTHDKGDEYRQLLIRAIHSCAVKFPEVADQVVHLLMEFLNSDGAIDVILFVRAMCESYPEMREGILDKLFLSLNDIKNTRVFRIAFWIIGEYCETSNSIFEAFQAIQTNLGPIPLTKFTIATTEQPQQPTAATAGPVSKSIVLADGTYATEVVYETQTIQQDDGISNFRKVILSGDFVVACAVSSALTKLCLKQTEKSLVLDAITYMSAFIAYGESNECKSSIDLDSKQRICICMKILLDPKVTSQYTSILLQDCRSAYTTILDQEKEIKAKAKAIEQIVAQADDLISFRQLRGKKALGSTDIDIDDGADINRATGAGTQDDYASQDANKLQHVKQLTGFADPVYAEATVTVHEYDILLELLVINRTPNTLNNLTCELSTMGDLKLVERPQTVTIGPLDQRLLRANIKVSSTETGHIFGTIVFESSSGAEKTYINLNDIHLDIMDYIQPATCDDQIFRSMWAEFEWENKVAIQTDMTDIVGFLNHIVEYTHMRCMSPPISQEDATISFLAANLYAKSIFGEDALANLSVEKRLDGTITGYVRIRSKTQGIALSLGDRITSIQRIN